MLQALTADTDLLFLANPNNPTGQLLGREYLPELLEHCRQQGIIVVLDECFIEFCETDREQPRSLLGKIDQYENLLLVRAFTKSFAMPGCVWDIWCAVIRASGENPQTAAGMESVGVRPESRHRLCGAGGAISAGYRGICENKACVS